jgi:hypothetical protein
MEVISLFYSGTEDAVMPKYKVIFDQCIDQVGRLLDVHFKVYYFKEMPGGLGDNAQSVIDEQVADNYQVYFGIMGTRFGKYTVHEYGKAVEAYIKNGKPNYVCFGFCEEPANPYAIEPTSLSELIAFRQDIAGATKYGRAMLYFTFDDPVSFQRRVEEHLKQAINVVKGRVAGGRSYAH